MAVNVDNDFATVEDGSSVAAKVRLNPRAYELSLARALVRVDRIQFLSARQAMVDVRVATYGGFARFQGWPTRRDDSWQVDRTNALSTSTTLITAGPINGVPSKANG